MIVVTPETKTSLLLNKNYQPFAVCTARAAFRHLITERVRGIDAAGNVVSWSGTEYDEHGQSSLRWFNNQINIYETQPCLRSGPDPITGEARKWAIPTILVCTHHFGYHKKPGASVSTRTLYKVYKGTCQYCYEKIPYSQATKDHAIPKSKGGTNDDFNLVLACRECNNRKDSIYPFYDINGKEVKPKKLQSFAFVPDVNNIREEWKPYLIQGGTYI